MIVRSRIPYLAVGDALDPDAQLLDLGVDSMTMVHLLLDLEAAVGVTIPDERLTPEALATPRSLRLLFEDARAAAAMPTAER